MSNTLCKYVTHCAIRLGDDVILERLVNEYLVLFKLAWPESYLKPKNHMLDHLKKYLRYVHDM